MATKMRVRELSKELGISNKELLHLLREENIPVKSHMSGLTEEQVQHVKEKFKEQRQDNRVQKKKGGFWDNNKEKACKKGRTKV